MDYRTSAKNKPKFILLSSLSIACLVSAFANPLQKMQVWRQQQVGVFNLGYSQHFIITEGDKYYPFGMDIEKAVKVEEIYQDYKIEKGAALVLAIALALSALKLGHDTCISAEINSEVTEIESEGKKQLILEAIKHRLALASKSQRLLFMDEMKSLIEEFGSIEGEILESDEVNATDKFTNAGYLLAEGHNIDMAVAQTWGVKAGTPEHLEFKRKFLAWQSDDEDNPVSQIETEQTDFRHLFPEPMDSSTWKAVCKSLAEGMSRSEIVRDVLGCSGTQAEIGEAYFEHLKRKFL